MKLLKITHQEMIELIQQIFEDKGLFLIHSSNIAIGKNFFAESNDNNRKDFFLIVEAKDLIPYISGIEANQSYSFESIYSNLLKETFYKPHFNKNITLLILLKNETAQINDKLKRQIYEIEENPYFFKKHILIYTENQLNDLKAKCPNISVAALEELVKNIDFKEFKAAPYADDYKLLLLNIYIKISFLKTPSKKKNIENLTSKITQILNARLEFQKLETLRVKMLTEDVNSNIYDLFNIPKNVNDGEL